MLQFFLFLLNRNEGRLETAAHDNTVNDQKTLWIKTEGHQNTHIHSLQEIYSSLVFNVPKKLF